ncbi:MAG: hypothetical protein ACREUF_05990, partial [Solimonas sp.]
MATNPGPAAFAQNLEFAREAMTRLDIAAAKFLATGEQMRISFQAFAQRGVVPITQRDFDALGRITDAVVILTQGQQTERQLWQEIGALIEGRVIPGITRLGTFIRAQVGDLEAWVDEHRRAGDLLPEIASKLRGFALAEKEILDLASTWRATLETVLDFVRRRAFAKPYEDVRDALRSIVTALFEVDQQTGEFTGKLTPLAETITEKVGRAWESFKDSVRATVGFLEDAHEALKRIERILNTISGGESRNVFVELRRWIQDSGLWEEVLNRSNPSRVRSTALLAPQIAAQQAAEIGRLQEEMFQALEVGRGRRRRRLEPWEILGISSEDFQKAQAKLRAAIADMDRDLLKARGDVQKAELSQFDDHIAELLALAKGHEEERRRIVELGGQLRAEVVERHTRERLAQENKVRQMILDLGARAGAEALRLMGRNFEAELVELNRNFQKERAAAEGHERQVLAVRQQAWVAFQTLVKNTYDDIIAKAKTAADEITQIDQQILATRKEFLGITPEQELAALEQLKQALAPGDVQGLQALNRQILDTSRRQIDSLQEEAKAARELAEQRQREFLEAPSARSEFLFNLARQRAIDLEATVKGLQGGIADRQKRLGQEILDALVQRRDELVEKLRGLRTEYDNLITVSKAAAKAVGDQFTALGDHIAKSIAAGAKQAAAALEALTGKK